MDDIFVAARCGQHDQRIFYLVQIYAAMVNFIISIPKVID